ncbi:MAG: Ribose import permease protein RbsC [Anaerolineae bacterium]|nr:Ribose import permease protein RbsC [Anaerolineae bacterium]
MQSSNSHISTKLGSPASNVFSKLSDNNLTTGVSLVVVLIFLSAVFASQAPSFLTPANFLNIGQTLATVGIVAIGMTMVLIAGGIDLSVGSTAALTGVTTAFVWTTFGLPLGVAVVVGMLCGVLVGVVNGFLITRININPLITTLGMFSIIRGLAFVISFGQTNQLNNEQFQFIGRGNIFGIPFSLLLMVALYLIFGFILQQTHFGRSLFAIGGSAEASRLSGIRINRNLMIVYIINSFLAALAGIIIASQLAVSAPRAAIGLELTVIAAVVLGGTSLSGGKGTLFGTLMGVIILRVLDNGLILMKVSSFYQDVASGVVLLLAVGFDQLRLRLGRRK